MNWSYLAICVFVAAAPVLAAKVFADQPEKTPAAASPSMTGKSDGEVRNDNSLEMKFVWCPPGFLTMENAKWVTEPNTQKQEVADGAESDPKDKAAQKPPVSTKKISPVKVFLTQGYWMGKYEVTQSEWKAVMETEPWKGQKKAKEGDDYAVAFVSWEDAATFCRTLTARERAAGRVPDEWEYTLPTEAQWEHACRARSVTRFSFGDDESKLGDYAWFSNNAWALRDHFAHRVGQKKPNAWGLHDMHGNLWEWCRDSWVETLPGGRDPEVSEEDATRRQKAETDRSKFESNWSGGVLRVMRGPSWFNTAPSFGSAERSRKASTANGLDIGFRVALSPKRSSTSPSK